MGAKRGPSGTQPHPSGRPITSVSGNRKSTESIYYIAYRPETWDSFRPPVEAERLIWEFYYSEKTYERAKDRLLAERHPKLYTGNFHLASLLHPGLATVFQEGV
jgi:hypothetical protein